MRAARVAAAVAPAIVVVASRAVRDALADLKVTIVENPDAAEGMASSIRRGVEAAKGDVLITLCDQPRVTSEHLRALVDARSPIAATGYSGIAGVPAFFSEEFRKELLALRGESGARQVIEAHRQQVVVIPFEAAGFDVDTPDVISL